MGSVLMSGVFDFTFPHLNFPTFDTGMRPQYPLHWGL